MLAYQLLSYIYKRIYSQVYRECQYQFSKLVLVVVYYPSRTSPAESNSPNLLNNLFDSLTRSEALFPNCRFVLVGGFNRLNITPLQNHFKLNQLVVKFPTRAQAMLDLLLTNMCDYFSASESFSPFGLSDHATVVVKPKIRVPRQEIHHHQGR